MREAVRRQRKTRTAGDSGTRADQAAHARAVQQNRCRHIPTRTSIAHAVDPLDTTVSQISDAGKTIEALARHKFIIEKSDRSMRNRSIACMEVKMRSLHLFASAWRGLGNGLSE